MRGKQVASRNAAPAIMLPVSQRSAQHIPLLSQILWRADPDDDVDWPEMLDRIKQLVGQGENVNERAWDGSTPLMVACCQPLEVAMEDLLALGADAGLQCDNGSSALSAAVFSNSPFIVRMLLRHGGEGVKRNALQHGLERLLYTARLGLDAHRVSVRHYCSDSAARIVVAARAHRLLCDELTAWFEQHQAPAEVNLTLLDPVVAASSISNTSNTSSSSGGSSRRQQRASETGSHGIASSSDQPPAQAHPSPAPSPLLSTLVLHRLVEKGDVARLRQALQLGADPNATGCDGHSLLMRAAANDQAEIVNLLISTGRCNLEQRDFLGCTALHHVLHCMGTPTLDSACILQQLIDSGCDVNAASYAGLTALTSCACDGHEGIAPLVPILLAAGADVHLRDVDGWDALSLAASTTASHSSILSALLDAGADVNSRACAYGPPVLLAAKCGNLGAVSLLLSRGADPNLPDACGLTALSWAQCRGHRRIAKVLQRAGGSATGAHDMQAAAVDQLEVDAIKASVHTALLPKSFRKHLLDTLSAIQPGAIKPGPQAGSSQGRAARGDTSSNGGGGSGGTGVSSVSSSHSAAHAVRGGVQRAAGPTNRIGSAASSRSSEEAERAAAELLAAEAAEKAKAQAAQAKRDKRARQRAKASVASAGVQAQGEAVAGLQERQEEELEGVGRADGACNGRQSGAVAEGGPAAEAAAASPPDPGPEVDTAAVRLAGLSLGSVSTQPAVAPPNRPLQSMLQHPPVPVQQQPQRLPQQHQPQAQPQQQQQQQHTTSAHSSAHDDDERYCVVCMEALRCMVLVPCGHVPLCEECCEAVQAAKNECPMCRATIDVAVTLNL